MQTPPVLVVETEVGFALMTAKFEAMPVALRAKFDGVTPEAVYGRINRGSALWASVFGQVWVLRAPIKK